jgi:hypothetical protein
VVEAAEVAVAAEVHQAAEVEAVVVEAVEAGAARR